MCPPVMNSVGKVFGVQVAELGLSGTRLEGSQAFIESRVGDHLTDNSVFGQLAQKMAEQASAHNGSGGKQIDISPEEETDIERQLREGSKNGVKVGARTRIA